MPTKRKKKRRESGANRILGRFSSEALFLWIVEKLHLTLVPRKEMSAHATPSEMRVDERCVPSASRKRRTAANRTADAPRLAVLAVESVVKQPHLALHALEAGLVKEVAHRRRGCGISRWDPHICVDVVLGDSLFAVKAAGVVRHHKRSIDILVVCWKVRPVAHLVVGRSGQLVRLRLEPPSTRVLRSLFVGSCWFAVHQPLLSAKRVC